MRGYNLSLRAAAAERRRSVWEGKEITAYQQPLVSGMDETVSLQNRSNFSTSTVTVTELAEAPRGNATGLSATWACVGLLAGTIASLPLMVYRTDRAGVRSVARDHPLYYVLHDSPNYDDTAVDFWEFMCAGVELCGNAYAEIAKRGNGSVYSLTSIRPDLVTTRRNGSGQIEYTWSANGRQRTVLQDGMFHIRGFGGDALGGASTLSACKQVFGGALDAERAANGMFANGARPSGLLSTDKALTGAQRAELEELLRQKYVGAVNAGRPMLLDNDLKWSQLTLSPEDAQMLETRRFSIEEICRVFGVPPHMIGHTENSTSWGTGLEQQTLGFTKFTLRRRVRRIEQALMKQLLTAADRVAGITIEFNLEGLLRGDSKGRADVNEIYLRNKVLTINEVRAQDNLPPVAWGDAPWVQQQDLQIGADGTMPLPKQEQE